MNDQTAYQGKELMLFEKALKWKKYFSSFITPYIKEEVVEIGAGLGANTPILNNGSPRSWILLEPDTSMSALLEEKLEKHALPSNCKVISGNISLFENKPLFDTIIYIDTLEHIGDDKMEMDKAAGLLKVGGHLIVLSPAFQFLFSPFDKAIGHFRRYTKRSLKKLMPPSLVQVDLRYLDSTGFFLSMTNRFILRQNYPTQRQVNFWDGYSIPVSVIMDRIMFYSFGKTILGIWKKTNQ